MNYIISSLLLTFTLGACIGNNVVKKKRNLELSCDHQSAIVFFEELTVSSGDSSEVIFIKVKNPKLNRRFSMERAPAASGAKYVSKDGKYIFWEHQGEFTFGTEDSTYCLCE